MQINAAFNATTQDPPKVERRSAENFEARIDALVDEAENIRLRLTRAHSGRQMMAMSAAILCVTIGATGFGWFLLVDGRIDTAVACMLIGIAVPYMVSIWADGPLKQYKSEYKTKFMPKLAHAIGRFQFHPRRGVPSKVISRTGVLPRFDLYKAEDCFMGLYNGVKVLFSEARLYPGKRAVNPIFDGIFVLLEIPGAPLQGHSILSSDTEMIRRYAGKRWKNLQQISLEGEVGAERFSMYSDTPNAAQGVIGERLFKELSEASNVFDNAPITVVFFAKKYVFLMLPYAHDMFEACSIHIPVKTQQHVIQCRREIEQILEIIDVFDLYQKAA